MDFSQIKAITIPEGSVKKITDSQGHVLWKKQGDRPTATASISITVGASKNITTTQYYNRICIPSINTIKSYIERTDNVQVKSIDTVLLNRVYFVRQYYTNAYYLKGFILNGSTIDSEIVAFSSIVTFPSGTSTYGKAITSTSATGGTDITSYLKTSSVKIFYGGFSGNSDRTKVSNTPLLMFSSSTGSGSTHYVDGTYSATVLPTFGLRVTYTYYTD